MLSFTYSEYEKFVQFLKASFPIYNLVGPRTRTGVIMRHDVDLSIDLAYRIAEIESKEGITSSYLILVNSPFYNPASLDNRNLLKRMVKMGFDIGLHFDPTIYPDTDDDGMIDHVRREADFLGSITGTPVKSVSLHNPSIHGKYLLFDGFTNSYDPEIFSSEIYLSDSRRQFRHDPYEFCKRAANTDIQILTHPAHYTETGSNYADIISSIIVDWANIWHNDFCDNSTYLEEINGKTLLGHIVSKSGML